MTSTSSIFLYLSIILVLSPSLYRCSCPTAQSQSIEGSTSVIRVGAEQLSLYLPQLKGRHVALVANHSARIREVHLLDTLLVMGIDVVKVFSPEHGFRGEADAGAALSNSIDQKTGLPIISLYGKNKKPTKDQMKGVDIFVFDIQDVGVRFYTYISTLHLVMEACAESNTPLILLDRPNPNAHYVDGPVLDTNYRSFVGMHPVPIVYGMTIGEYGKMINGEQWLRHGIQCHLSVIPCRGYRHDLPYPLPRKPSPNLPNYRAVLLYPSLCLLEPTSVSIGRGTEKQFQMMGHPDWPDTLYAFTPHPNPGASHPKLEGTTCYGYDLTVLNETDIFQEKRLHLQYLLTAWHLSPHSNFFRSNAAFDRIAGSATLRHQLLNGASESTIRQSWETGLSAFRDMRQKYLIYP